MMAVLLHRDSASAQGEASILRGRALELVDHRGGIRADLRVESDGEVVLRLRDQAGSIRVKLSAGKDGSGLTLLNDATELGVQVLSKAEGSSLKLVDKDGRQKVIVPEG